MAPQKRKRVDESENEKEGVRKRKERRSTRRKTIYGYGREDFEWTLDVEAARRAERLQRTQAAAAAAAAATESDNVSTEEFEGYTTEEYEGETTEEYSSTDDENRTETNYTASTSSAPPVTYETDEEEFTYLERGRRRRPAWPEGPLQQFHSIDEITEGDVISQAEEVRAAYDEGFQGEPIQYQRLANITLPTEANGQLSLDVEMVRPTLARFNALHEERRVEYNDFQLDLETMREQLDNLPMGAQFTGTIDFEMRLDDFVDMFPWGQTVDFVINIVVLRYFAYENKVLGPFPAKALHFAYFGLVSQMIQSQDPSHDVFDDEELVGSDRAIAHVIRNVRFWGKKVPATSEYIYSDRRIVRAAGFKNKVIRATTISFSSGFKIFFPFNHGEECLLACALQACDWFAEEKEAEARDYLKTLFNSVRCVNGSGWKKRKDGVSTKKIRVLNAHCSQAFFAGRAPVLFEFIVCSLHDSNKLLPRRQPVHSHSTVGPLYIPVKVAMIHFNGEFHKRVPGGQKDIPGGAHYCLFDGQLSDRVARVMYEKALFSHIHNDPLGSLDEKLGILYTVNKQAIEKEKEEARRKKEQLERRVRRMEITHDTSEGQEEEKFPTQQTVFVADMECLFERYPGDDLDMPVKELKKVLDTEVMFHVPCAFAFAPLDLTHCSTLEFDERSNDEECQGIIDSAFFGRVPTIISGEYMCINRSVKTMAEHARNLGMKKVYVYMHNACKYDSFQILKYLQKEDGITIPYDGLLKTGRGVLNLSILVGEGDGQIEIVCRCTKVYFTSSLEQLCKSFKVPKIYEKKEWAWDASKCITRARLRQEEYREEMHHYLTYDIYSLGFVALRMERLLRVLDPYEQIEKKWTPRIYSTTFQSFLRKLLKKKYLKSDYVPNVILDYDELLLSALRGGLCQPAVREFHMADWLAIEHHEGDSMTMKQMQFHLSNLASDEDAYVSLDANSLYPDRMCTPMPIGPGELLSADETKDLFDEICDKEYPEDWAIIVVVFTSFPDSSFPIYSSRTKLGLEYSKPVYGEPCCHTSDDLMVFRWIGAEFTILKSVWWRNENLTMEYADFVNSVYTMRREERDELIKGIYKNALVSAFGITGFEKITGKTVVLPSNETLPEKEFFCGNVVEKIPLDACDVYTLKGIEGHVYQDLSTKSTVTSCVLSRSRYHMFLSLKKAGETGLRVLQRGGHLIHMLELVAYMDTDSFFVPKYVVDMFDAAGLIGNELGQFKNDYNGVIVSLLCPAPKVRQQVIVAWDEKLGRYTAVLKTRFKGVVITGDLKCEYAQRAAFRKLCREWVVASPNTRWNKTINAGVSTGPTEYNVDEKALMKNKAGVWVNTYKEKIVYSKFIPHGLEHGYNSNCGERCLSLPYPPPGDDAAVGQYIADYDMYMNDRQEAAYLLAVKEREEWEMREEYNEIYHPE